MTPLVLCADPGFAAFGFAILRLGFTSESLVAMGLVRTQSEQDRRKVVDDEVRRTREIFNALRSLLRIPDAIPDGRFVAIAAEAFSMGGGKGGSTAARKVAFGVAALVCVAEMHSLPILQESPSDIRGALGLASPIIVRGTPDKERQALKKQGKLATRAAIIDRFPLAPTLVDGIAERFLEHPYDAVAAGLASLKNDTIRAVRLSAA